MNDYKPGDRVAVLANKLTSLSNTLPYSYYSIPFCRPHEKIKSKPVNLGQILMGERAFPTAFSILMMKEVQCRHMCTVDFSKLKPWQFKKLQSRIRQNYFARLNVDNMPLLTRFETESETAGFRFGHPIGYKAKDGLFLYNHLSLKILYHQPSLSTGEAFDTLAVGSQSYRIVGFEVAPYSIAHKYFQNGHLDNSTCQKRASAEPQPIHKDAVVTYTYDVTFEESELAWATRWDPILDTNAEIQQIQWFSIVNSLMVSFFLAALAATALLSTVKRDFGRYNADEDDEDMEVEVTGWKYVHGDIFRPPKHAAFLSICVGSGAQVLVMACLTQLFALIGFLSPANRGALLSALLTLYVAASSVSGYVSAKVYNSIDNGVARRVVTLGTALLFPGITFSIFFCLNVVMWFVGSSGSVPFATLVLLLFMWFCISVPLVFVGSAAAYRQKAISFPTRTHHIPRQIPPPPFGIPSFVYAIFAGLLPFGSVFVEVVFILNSVWSGSVYYLYGALVSVFGILVVTCIEMSIVSTYLTLSAEDWSSHWHISFWGSGSSGVYVFLYSIYYSLEQPNKEVIPFVSQLVYVCWSLVMSGAFGLMCGTIGFFASLWFTRKIYASIRID